MAELLRVYRRFYHILVSDQSSSYTLMDPLSLTAIVRNVSLGNTVVEATASTVNTTVGVYYADLVPSLYDSDSEYEIEWRVVYESGAPSRSLYTMFRYPDQAVQASSTVVRELDFEVINEPALEIEINKHVLKYTIERN